jgi:hypothetical protein
MPNRAKATALPAAMLLAATGGLLDAVVYLNHGHVFANAMTGNVIFLGISALGRDWADVGHHIALSSPSLQESSPPACSPPRPSAMPQSLLSS